MDVIAILDCQKANEDSMRALDATSVKRNEDPVDELKKSIWTDYLKPWVDYRTYFRQRAIILSRPDLLFEDEVIKSREWKSPLAFALQGTLVIAAALGLCSTLFSNFVAERPTVVFRVVRTDKQAEIIPESVPEGRSWAARQKRIEKDQDTLKSELEQIRKVPITQKVLPPIPYSEVDNPTLFMLSVAISMQPVSRSQAIAEYEAELTALDRQLRVAKLAPYIDKASEKLDKIMPAFALLLGAYCFRYLIKWRAVSRNARVHRAHIEYLYFVTARLFWVSLAWTIAFNVRIIIAHYFPEQFSSMVQELDRSLRAVDAPNTINVSSGQAIYSVCVIAIVIWGLVTLWRVSMQLAPVFGMAEHRSPKRWYEGRTKVLMDIIVANAVAGVITVVLFSLVTEGYAIASLWLDKVKL